MKTVSEDCIVFYSETRARYWPYVILFVLCSIAMAFGGAVMVSAKDAFTVFFGWLFLGSSLIVVVIHTIYLVRDSFRALCITKDHAIVWEDTFQNRGGRIELCDVESICIQCWEDRPSIRVNMSGGDVIVIQGACCLRIRKFVEFMEKEIPSVELIYDKRGI